jgi:site-specific DNA recombinase
MHVTERAVPRQRRRPVAEHNVTRAAIIVLGHGAVTTFDELRARDDDPAYADAPRLDLYARISLNRDEETEKTDKQIIDILRGMKHRQCRLGEIWRDDNLSAWARNGKRHGWDATLERVESGAVDGVFVPHIDRYLRQPRQLERLIDASDKGSLIWSQYGEFDLGTSMGRYVARQMVSQAAMQSDEHSRRAKSRNAHKREDGIGHGGPRGFGQPSGPHARVATPPEVVEAEQDAIRWAVEQIVNDADYKLAAIGREWERRGFASAAMQVRGILSQPRIAGLLTFEKRVIGKRADVEPIITREQYEKVMRVFNSRKRGRPYSFGNSPLSGILACGRCGKPLFGKVTTRGKDEQAVLERQYRCPTRGGCGKTCVKAETVDAVVRDQVIRVLFSPEHTEAMRRQVERLDAARQRLVAAEERLRSLADRLKRDELTEIEYDVLAPRYRQDVKDARWNVDLLELGSVPAVDAPYAVTTAEANEKLSQDWDTGGIEGQRAMARRAFRRIVVKPATSTRQPAAERLEYEPWT